MRHLPPTNRTLLFSLLLLLVIVSGSARAVAQSALPSPTPTKEELELQQQKRLLELQRDIEVAKKAIRDAQPKPEAAPSVTPLSGDTTLDEGVRMETNIVSYKAMAEAAAAIVRDIGDRLRDGAGPKRITNLAIYDAETVRNWRFFQAVFPAFVGQTEDILTRYNEVVCNAAGVDPVFHKNYCRKKTGDLFAANERFKTADLNEAAVLSAFSVGGNLIKSFIDVAALFRTETKISGKSVTIDESALVAELFRMLKTKSPDTNLYYPKVFPPRPDPDAESPTITLVGLLFTYKAEADRLIKKETGEQEALATVITPKVREKAQLETELAQVKLLKDQLANLYSALRAERVSVFRQKLWQEINVVQTELSKLKSQSELEARINVLKGQINPVLANIEAKGVIIKRLSELNARFQHFVDEFVKVDGNGVNALALFIRSEDITGAMSDEASYWLEIKPVAAGGNNRVRKNLIWFFAGARLDHSGGVIIEYTLYDKTGAVLVSDKLSHYEGYIPPKKIKGLRDPDPK